MNMKMKEWMDKISQTTLKLEEELSKNSLDSSADIVSQVIKWTSIWMTDKWKTT